MNSNNMNIFDAYKGRVSDNDLVRGLTKTRAIDLSTLQVPGTISPATIQALYESLSCEGWSGQKGSNWVWRHAPPEYTDGHSDEVSLERAVAAHDVDAWGCQMSTSSGVQGPHLHRRRAIDLVRFIGVGHYAFVELKVGSDNPLYAAFEILGYALAYLHAKSNGWAGMGAHNVFDAERIELTILGPDCWYMYDKRGADKKFEYKLEWLADEIANSLNEFVKAELNGMPTFTMKFRSFSGGTRDQQAADICRRAECEWWES